MPPFEVFFKAKHDCPFCNLSGRLPSAKMFVWCNSISEVVEIVLEKRSDYRKVRKVLDTLVDITDEAFEGENIYLVTKKCDCTFDNSVTVRLEAHNILYLSPVSYEAGWETYHTIAFRHNDFRRFMESASQMPAEIIITRKTTLNGNIRSLLPISVGSLFGDLTVKQIEALLTSYSMGYFRFPRKRDVKGIAEVKRVPRTTFQEHLTKAENKVIAALVPYLKLFQAKSEQNQPSACYAEQRVTHH